MRSAAENTILRAGHRLHNRDGARAECALVYSTSLQVRKVSSTVSKSEDQIGLCRELDSDEKRQQGGASVVRWYLENRNRNMPQWHIFISIFEI
jgi:hypothetical protein